jgi:hypothetical protein
LLSVLGDGIRLDVSNGEGQRNAKPRRLKNTMLQHFHRLGKIPIEAPMMKKHHPRLSIADVVVKDEKYN